MAKEAPKTESTKYSLFDRIVLENIRKHEGNFITLILWKDISEKVKPTQSELKEYQVVVNKNGTISMTNEASESIFGIDFTDAEKSEIKETLKKLDESNKLTTEHLSLYRKFVA